MLHFTNIGPCGLILASGSPWLIKIYAPGLIGMKILSKDSGQIFLLNLNEPEG